ncbi:MAG: hypothetical protein K0S28_1752 [Paucimonas sp.]|jgi:hypothetical protein|nr:hypothetical protein [Paucimonas sp.]
MTLDTNIAGILRQYAQPGALQENNIEGHFEQVARELPMEDVSLGLKEAFLSERTPSFADLVGLLFRQANPQEKAGMLSHLLRGMPSPGIASLLGGGGASSPIGGVLAMAGSGEIINVSEAAASQIEPEQFEEIAHRAEQETPEIVEHMSAFLATNPALAKMLGNGPLSLALEKIAQRH